MIAGMQSSSSWRLAFASARPLRPRRGPSFFLSFVMVRMGASAFFFFILRVQFLISKVLL